MRGRKSEIMDFYAGAPELPNCSLSMPQRHIRINNVYRAELIGSRSATVRLPLPSIAAAAASSIALGVCVRGPRVDDCVRCMNVWSSGGWLLKTIELYYTLRNQFSSFWT